ncbi:uncharacterized protein F4817DRAFT_366599 [Daldinia loculata]|uniref:uncharacterized protein n=1 Tax=Daldinia loculata TaxID=103429 RepID=UPI0020C40FDE|nr:uncharacterized protein F4817DRAFT_366599 [Daldinia loculata]KAI1645433.1 hypothetical protein F4817DRAFT_366599 [Daldinia loculata]
MATNAESSAMAVAKGGSDTADVVIWGIVYNDDYKKNVKEKTVNQFYEESLRPKGKSATKSSKAKVNNDDIDSGNNNSTGNTLDLRPGEVMGENILAPEGKFLKAIVLEDGRRQDIPETKSYRPVYGPSEPKTAPARYTPRTSMQDIHWAMIATDGKSYHKANERDGVNPQKMGPAKGSPFTLCDVEKDIFIIDRYALACVERPDGVNGNHKADIFGTTATKQARQRIDDWLLRPKNVLFNVNDPGSLLIYLDLLERASKYGKDGSKDLLNQKRTVGFFSGPKQCNHDDCNKWRNEQATKMRTPAQKNILKQPWWVFADFCPMGTNAISFKTSQHSEDIISIENIRNEDANRTRAFCHAVLNHSPFKEGYAILHQDNMFPLLVHASGQCLTPNDTGRDKLDEIVSQVRDGRACYGCAEKRDTNKIFGMNDLLKDQATGLIYLNYEVDEDTTMMDA